VIAMVVRAQDRVDLRRLDAISNQLPGGGRSIVEQQYFPADINDVGGTKTFRRGARGSTSNDRDLWYCRFFCGHFCLLDWRFC